MVLTTAEEVFVKEARKGNHHIDIRLVKDMFKGNWPCSVCFTKKQPRYSNRNLPSIGWFDGWTCPNCMARTSECVTITDAKYVTTCNKTHKILTLWVVDSEGGDDS